MASHSSVLAWRISRTKETGGLQFIGSNMTLTYHAHTRTFSSQQLETFFNGCLLPYFISLFFFFFKLCQLVIWVQSFRIMNIRTRAQAWWGDKLEEARVTENFEEWTPLFHCFSSLCTGERKLIASHWWFGILPEQPNLIQTQCGFRNWKQHCYTRFFTSPEKRRVTAMGKKAFQMYFKTML